MIKLLYIILIIVIFNYVYTYKEPFSSEYINLNKNARYFREKRNQIGENIEGIFKMVKRLV
jgi:hypothetical protein